LRMLGITVCETVESSSAQPRDDRGPADGSSLRASAAQHLENTKLQDDHGRHAQRRNEESEA
jgi:hypothetical protein